MKLYDFDGMFDERLSQYIQKYADKYKESEWENIIPEMYKKFGDTTIKSLGKSPNAYYGGMDDETLVKTLRAHIKQGVPVSEYLCKAIEGREGCVKLMLPLLSGSEDEVTYCMNIIGSADEAIGEYLRIMLSTESEDLKNACADYIKEKSDLVKDRALALYSEGRERELMLEILSRCTVPDERIYEILLREFRTDPENVPMHASYLAVYGDERALPYLLDKIDEEGISYIEYQELKYAIETLGGSYDKERDFSSDPYYQLIKQHSADNTDLFSIFNDDTKN